MELPAGRHEKSRSERQAAKGKDGCQSLRGKAMWTRTGRHDVAFETSASHSGTPVVSST